MRKSEQNSVKLKKLKSCNGQNTCESKIIQIKLHDCTINLENNPDYHLKIKSEQKGGLYY